MPIFAQRLPDPYRPFLPGFRSPLYLHLRPLWQGLSRSLGSCTGRVLDVGCGIQPYRSLLGPGVVEYVGVDRPGDLSGPHVYGTAEDLPFADASFDVVMLTQVLEHVMDPRCVLAEATRVLKPGGRVIITMPGTWPTHEAPYDFWRFTRHGSLMLMKEFGLDGELEMQGGMWACIGQMICLEWMRSSILRELIPVVNVACRLLDRLGSREDMGLNWLIDAQKPRL